MKKKIIAIAMLATVALSSFTILAGCGGENQTASTEDVSSVSSEVVKEYLEPSQINDFFTSPSSYKGKYVTLTGKVFADPEVLGDLVCLQVFHDVENYSKNFIVYGTSAESISNNDFVKIDGLIDGTFTGENAFGGTIICPQISNATIKKSSYMDIVTPTISKITPKNASMTQHNLTISVSKIEFAEKETRVYLKATNKSPDKCYIDIYGAAIVQNGNQINQDTSSMSQFDGNYDTLSYELLSDASDTGILVFPPVDNTVDFKVNVSASSDNYYLNFSDYAINITTQ